MSLPRLQNEDNIHTELLIQYGNDEAVDLVAEKIAKATDSFFSPNGGNRQVYFIRFGRTEQFKNDFKKYSTILNMPSYKLSVAVIHHRPDIVTFLHDNYKTPFASPTFEAAWNQDLVYFHKLKECLEKPGLSELVKTKLLQKDECGYQPIHYAIASGNVPHAMIIFKYLMPTYDELIHLPLVALTSRQLQCFRVFMDRIASEHANGTLKFPEGAISFKHYLCEILDDAIRFHGDPSVAIIKMLEAITNETYRKTWVDSFLDVAYQCDYLDIYTAIGKKFGFDEKSTKEATLAVKRQNNPLYYQLLDLINKKELGKNLDLMLDQHVSYFAAGNGSADDYYCAAQLAFLARRPKLAREWYDKFTAMQPTNDWFQLAAQAATRKAFVLFDKLNCKLDPSFFELYENHFFELTNVKSAYFHIVFDALLFCTKLSLTSSSLNELLNEFIAIQIPTLTVPANESTNVSQHNYAALEFVLLAMMELIYSSDLTKKDFNDSHYGDKINALKKFPSADRIIKVENLIVLYSIIDNLIHTQKVIFELLPHTFKSAMTITKYSFTKATTELKHAVYNAQQALKKIDQLNNQLTSAPAKQEKQKARKAAKPAKKSEDVETLTLTSTIASVRTESTTTPSTASTTTSSTATTLDSTEAAVDKTEQQLTLEKLAREEEKRALEEKRQQEIERNKAIKQAALLERQKLLEEQKLAAIVNEKSEAAKKSTLEKLKQEELEKKRQKELEAKDRKTQKNKIKKEAKKQKRLERIASKPSEAPKPAAAHETHHNPFMTKLDIDADVFLKRFPPSVVGLLRLYGPRIILFGGALCDLYAGVREPTDYDFKFFGTLKEILDTHPNAKIKSDDHYASVTITIDNIEHDITILTCPLGMSLEEAFYLQCANADANINALGLCLVEGAIYLLNSKKALTDIIHRKIEFPDPENTFGEYFLHPERYFRTARKAFYLNFFPSATVTRELLNAQRHPQLFAEACAKFKTKVNRQYHHMLKTEGSDTLDILVIWRALAPLIYTDIIASEAVLSMLVDHYGLALAATILLDQIGFNINLHQDLAYGIPASTLQAQYNKMLKTIGRDSAYRMIHSANLLPIYLWHTIINPKTEFYENATTFGTLYAQYLLDFYCIQHYIPRVRMPLQLNNGVNTFGVFAAPTGTLDNLADQPSLASKNTI